MKKNFSPWIVILSAICLCLPRAAAAKPCESLASLALPDTTIMLTQDVPAGAFTLPAKPGINPMAALEGVAPKDLPAFCRVAIRLKPSSDSDIKVEVWMPAAGWNGKFMAVGNGGWAGTISYQLMAEPLSRGYATASTDTGHEGDTGGGRFAQGHPEKVTDFAYRAVHEMTVKAKAVIAAYYGQNPKRSYWNGCSTGGKQGLKEAQRFPEDFDGIVAGAPANHWVHLSASSLWFSQAVLATEASFIPASKFPVIHRAALAACDARDGVKDGVIGNPQRCTFDPQEIECTGVDGPDCLTAAQVVAARKIYGPITNPRTKALIFPGLLPGSELGWAVVAGPQAVPIAADYFKYVVFKNPDWDFQTFDFDKDLALADRTDDGLIAATDPNLREFFGHGGKLLQYHGWSDPLISPVNSVNYYSSVMDAMGAAAVKDSYRLFMMPGMNHCSGGDGPDHFDSIEVIEQWVEQGKAPEQIIASHLRDGKVDRTRPLCPYPQVAAYTGTGSTDDSKNFVCASEK